MKVIVCGGRDLPETGPLAQEWIEATCKALRRWGVTLVISGAARGGDRIGELAATALGIPVERHPAQWSKYGRSAGILRNLEMLANADGTIALPGGRGTTHMINATAKAHKRLLCIADVNQKCLFEEPH